MSEVLQKNPDNDGDDFKNQTNIDIPPAVFNMLNEHVGGGFVLFYINGDNQLSEKHNIDNMVNFAALKDYIKTWSGAIEEIDHDTMVEGISMENLFTFLKSNNGFNGMMDDDEDGEDWKQDE